MRVAAVQHDVAWEDRAATLARLEPQLQAAAGAGARLVVLTEMFPTGFSMEPERTAEPEGGPSTEFLRTQAPDGSWAFNAHRPVPSFMKNMGFEDYQQLGSHGAVESGLIARNAYELLRVYRFTGRPELLEGGRRALDRLAQFDVPRAAQGWEVHSEPVRLGRLLGNLLVNAVRYTPRGGIALRAAWRQEPGERLLEVSVTDTGPGIPREEHESIFQPYERGRVGRDSDSGGSGLGLAVVDRLVEELGLRVEVESITGHGSTFVVLVPATLLRRASA